MKKQKLGSKGNPYLVKSDSGSGVDKQKAMEILKDEFSVASLLFVSDGYFDINQCAQHAHNRLFPDAERSDSLEKQFERLQKRVEALEQMVRGPWPLPGLQGIEKPEEDVCKSEFEIVFDFNVNTHWLDPPNKASDLFIRERMRQSIELDVKGVQIAIQKMTDKIIKEGKSHSLAVSIEERGNG